MGIRRPADLRELFVNKIRFGNFVTIENNAGWRQ
jgi:hypothetical protein